MVDTFSEANILIEKNQYEYAIFLLTDNIKHNLKPQTFLTRGTCYMRLHRYQEAIKDIEKAIELDRTMSNAYIKLSKCYVAIGDLQNAINTLTILINMDKNDSFAQCELQNLKNLKELNKKADQLFEKKKYHDVVYIMDKCLEKAEICVKFKLIKAECLVYLGEHENALNTVNEILFTNNNDFEAICIRALNLMHQEKYLLGLAELREIMPLSPRAKVLYRKYKQIVECLKQANIEFKNNNLIKAEKLYSEVLRLNKRNEHKNRQILLKLAQIFLKQKQYENCIDMTCDILEYDTNNIKALEFRAKCNLELKEYDLAIEDYRTILSLGTERSEIERNLKIAEQRAKTQHDSYEILNLDRNNISASIIKAAYHKLAKIYHPDKATITRKYTEHKLNLKFAKINKAKEELLKIHNN